MTPCSTRRSPPIAREGTGGVSIRAVCAAAGVPSGVVNHRFGSRDELVLTLWLRTAERFQSEFIAVLDRGDVEEAAVHVVRWVRAHPAEAELLLGARREDLAERAPRGVQRRARALGAALDAALERAAQRLGGPSARARLAFAAVRIPEAAVRPYLKRGERIPRLQEALVRSAVRGVLGLPPGP
jgi:AcrR family transcriptional regulator